MIKGLTLRHVYLANAALVALLLSGGIGFFLAREFPAGPSAASAPPRAAAAPWRHAFAAGEFPGLDAELPAEPSRRETLRACAAGFRSKAERRRVAACCDTWREWKAVSGDHDAEQRGPWAWRAPCVRQSGYDRSIPELYGASLSGDNPAGRSDALFPEQKSPDVQVAYNVASGQPINYRLPATGFDRGYAAWQGMEAGLPAVPTSSGPGNAGELPAAGAAKPATANAAAAKPKTATAAAPANSTP